MRLSSFGLDWDGNDYLIGIVGKELHEVSDAVARLRSTELATRYVDHRGPFFLGKAIWQTGTASAAGPEAIARW